MENILHGLNIYILIYNNIFHGLDIYIIFIYLLPILLLL